MPTHSTCRDEIETLHDFFVDWYAARIPKHEFVRMERAIAPGFEMVTPDGVRCERSAVLEAVRESYGRDDPGEFDIEIQNVELIERLDGHALVRYEEWQTTADERTGRVSTVLLREESAAPGGLQWIHVHETWIER